MKRLTAISARSSHACAVPVSAATAASPLVRAPASSTSNSGFASPPRATSWRSITLRAARRAVSRWEFAAYWPISVAASVRAARRVGSIAIAAPAFVSSRAVASRVESCAATAGSPLRRNASTSRRASVKLLAICTTRAALWATLS